METGNPPLMYYDVTDIFIMVGFASWIISQGPHLKIENALHCHLPCKWEKSSGMDTMKVYFLSKVDGSKSAVNEVSLCNKETPTGFVERTT